MPSSIDQSAIKLRLIFDLHASFYILLFQAHKFVANTARPADKMFSGFLNTTIVLTAILTAVNSHTQGGICGDNGLDGITGTVPACMFLAGTTVRSSVPQINLSGSLTECFSIMERAFPTSYLLRVLLL
jgi:hypothetical protein